MDQVPAAPRNDRRGVLSALTCALFFFLVLASANADAPSAREGLVFLRIGAMIAGVFFVLVAVRSYLVGRRGWIAVLGVLLPFLWLGALFVAFMPAMRAFDWLLQ